MDGRRSVIVPRAQFAAAISVAMPCRQRRPSARLRGYGSCCSADRVEPTTCSKTSFSSASATLSAADTDPNPRKPPAARAICSARSRAAFCIVRNAVPEMVGRIAWMKSFQAAISAGVGRRSSQCPSSTPAAVSWGIPCWWAALKIAERSASSTWPSAQATKTAGKSDNAASVRGVISADLNSARTGGSRMPVASLSACSADCCW